MSFISKLIINSVTTHAAGALLAAGLTAGAAWFLIPGPHEITIPEPAGPTPFTAITRTDLSQALKAAKRRIIAAGYVLSDIDADFIRAQHDKFPGFEAIVVMVDPLGEGGPNRVMCQRQRDEDGDTTSYSNYSRVLSKLIEFRSPKTRSLLGKQLKVGLIDMYPTMAVMLVDDDLYAYFYSYEGGRSSPVIKFENYVHTKDKRGEYYDDYLNKVTWYKNRIGVRKTIFPSSDQDWKRYEGATLDSRCKK